MQSKNVYKQIYKLFLIILAGSALFCKSQSSVVSLPIYQLPLFCFLCFLLFHNIRRHINSLSVMTISIVCIIRYGLYPITICIERVNYASYVVFSYDAFNLMLYEMVSVLFFLNYYASRLDTIQYISIYNKVNCGLTIINKILLVSMIPLTIVYPSLLSIFTFFGVDKSNYPISGVILVSYSIGLYIGYIYLLSKFSKYGNGSLLNLLMSFGIIIFYIFITAIGDSSVSRWAFLWIGIPSIIILTDLFPKYRNIIATFSCIILPFGIILGSFVKFALTDFSIESFFSNFITSDTLSEYFGGLNGLSYVVQNLVDNVKVNTTYSMLTDLFCSTPVLSTFFDFENYSTQSIYLDFLNRRDLICPMLGQSYLHFGFWGAPLFSIMMVILAVEFDRISKSARYIYLKYASLSLCITFSLFMCLNTIIILSNAWSLIIFLLIQLYNSKK